MTSCLQIVDGISANPTIRLDLDDQDLWSVNAETTFPPPPLRRSVTSTLLTDGETISASAYGNRELRLVLKLHSEIADTDATQVQKLVRELDKVTNVFRYTPPGASTPLFFRTFRAAPETVIWDKMERKCFATVPAEPFGIGLRQDLGTTVVSQNPAAGANGCFIDVTGVKGDVETPLLLTYDAGATGLGGFQFPGLMFGLRSGAAPYPTLFRQAESLTLGTDASVVADAAFSGGSKVRISFATNTLTERLTGSFPTGTLPAGAEQRGRYRILARVAAVTAQADYLFRTNALLPSSGGAAVGPDITLNINPRPTMIDLGVFDARTVEPPAPGLDPVPYGVSVLPSLQFLIQRTGGSPSSLDIDYILLVPASERLGTWEQMLASASTDLCVVDGVNESLHAATTGLFTTSRVTGGDAPGVEGEFPMVRPGSNRLVILQTAEANASGAGSLITDATTVSAYCWPRYLYVRPIAT